MQWFFIHMMLFIDNFNFQKGYNLDFKIIYFHGAFYDHKFSKMSIQGKCVSFYFHGSIL